MLVTVAALAPAISMATQMIHPPVQESQMDVENCHEVVNQSMHVSLESISSSSSSECCDASCECAALACSAQLASLSNIFASDFSSSLFYLTKPSYYSSVSFAPQSPPPTR